MGKPSTFESDIYYGDQIDIEARTLISQSYTLSNDALNPIIESLDKLYKNLDQLLYDGAKLVIGRFYILKLRRDIDGRYKRDESNKDCKYYFHNQCQGCIYGSITLDPTDRNKARCYCYLNPCTIKPTNPM